MVTRAARGPGTEYALKIPQGLLLVTDCLLDGDAMMQCRMKYALAAGEENVVLRLAN